MNILVTDKTVIPKNMRHRKIRFREVKYSESELERFMGIAGGAYLCEELSAVWTNTAQNNITVQLIEGADAGKLSELLPRDSYDYHFVQQHTVKPS